MVTIVYCAKERIPSFEKKLAASSGIESPEILFFAGDAFAKSYNEALEKARHDTVIFIREDVLIDTPDWAAKIHEQLTKSNYGILGVVGSMIVPMSGLVWEKEEPLVGRIWYETFETRNEHRFSEVFKGKIISVITVDDAFFAVSKKRLKAHFDLTYKKDSFYELDFCLANYVEAVQIGVTFEIKVLKTAFDHQDKTWIENRKLFVEKHRKLPFRLKPEIVVTKGGAKLKQTPKVALIIPVKNKPVELAACLESIYDKENYPNLDIVVVDLGSKKDHQKSMEDVIRGHEYTRLIDIHNEHIPSVLEEVVEKHLHPETELLVFCDPEIVLINDAVTKMVKVYLENEENCGTLGIRMHTKSHMIRHFGLMLFSTETQEGYELGLGFQGYQSAYKYQNKVIKNVLGSSKDFLMISKKLYQKVGGFNKNYLHSLEDFELNIKAIVEGKKNFLVGSAVSYFSGQEVPKFLPSDFVTLVNFINTHVEVISPFVGLLEAA